MKKIYVLDGMRYLFRAYHAFPSNIVTNDNQPANMIFWFARMITKLLAEKPDNLIVARDPPSISLLRSIQFPAYKAQRTDMPDDFKVQVGHCKDLCKTLGLCTLEYVGYEADDSIYTLAKNFITLADAQLFVYTWDKDMKQILNYPNVHIQDPIKEIERTKKHFVQEFGFEPEYMADYLALIGDVSDNIPGARGIGPKGAKDLICKFQTIENIYNNLDQILEKTRTLLEESKDNVLKAKELILLYEVPSFDYDFNSSYKPDIVLRKEILVGKYNFRSFEKVLDDLKKQFYFTQSGGLF